MAWTGSNTAQTLNLGMIELAKLQQGTGAAYFEGKIIYPTASVGAPALAATTSGYDLILAWAGTDGTGNLYTAYLDFPFSPPTPHIN